MMVNINPAILKGSSLSLHCLYLSLAELHVLLGGREGGPPGPLEFVPLLCDK